MSKRIAVFPGSFDPLTLGHVDIIRRSVALFDEVIVAIGVNAAKSGLYPPEIRKQFIEDFFRGIPNVSVEIYQGLTVDFCQKKHARFIVRGLRNATDFEYEKTIAHANEKLSGIETVSIFTAPELSYISSTIVRDVIKNGGDIYKFVPPTVKLP